MTNEEISRPDGHPSRGVVIGSVDGGIHGSIIAQRVYSGPSVQERLDTYLALAAQKYKTWMTGRLISSRSVPGRPYMFLDPFTVEDADIFCGRDAALQTLSQALSENRLLLLSAQSGTGKTSLLQAGLAPQLVRQGRMPVYVRSYDHPVAAIKEVLTSQIPDPWPPGLADLSLNRFLGLVIKHLSPSVTEIVVILDQFEEFFLLWPSLRIRHEFANELGQCYENGGLPARFAIALREEYLPQLTEFTAGISGIFHHEVPLDAMTRDEVRAAIVNPLGRRSPNVQMEPTLVERLLDDITLHEPGLPQLQIVCTRLFEVLRGGEGTITLEMYEDLHGAQGILGGYLDWAFDRMPGSQATVAREVLKELVSSIGTGRALPAEIISARVSTDEHLLQQTLSKLVEFHLLRLEKHAGQLEYELAHGYLIEKIRPWIKEDELEIKQAQELLRQETVSWRVYETPSTGDRLDRLAEKVEYLNLELNPDAQQMLLASALTCRHQVGFWAGHVADTKWTVQQIADHLVANRKGRRRVVKDLKSNLPQELQEPLATTLWQSVATSSGFFNKLKPAHPLGRLLSWLPLRTQRLQVLQVLGLYSAGVMALTLLVLAILAPLGARVWPYATRELAVRGDWILVEGGSTILGLDESSVRFSQSECEASGDATADCEKKSEKWFRGSPQRTVALSTFQILENEVTNAQYKQCVDAGICSQPTTWLYGGRKSEREPGYANLPVTGISWFEAATFCEDWLGGRLPTSEEWEKAARGPDGNFYPWGTTWGTTKPKVNLEGGKDATVLPVDSAEVEDDVSFYGVRNLAGNVREWTATGQAVTIDDQRFRYQVTPRQVDTDTVWALEIQLRSGAWRNLRHEGLGWAYGVDTAVVYEPEPNIRRAPEIGFRCVCPEIRDCNRPWKLIWQWFGAY